MAFLTTAAPIWNNWARENPSFVVSMLQLQAYLAVRPASEVPRSVGQPLEVKLDPVQVEPQVRFTIPTPSAVSTATVDAEPTPDGRYTAVMANTDASGVYQARLIHKDGKEEIRSFAVNVDADEGDLRALTYPELATRLEGVRHQYQLASDFQVGPEQLAGQSLRTSLLYFLVIVLVGEQLLAYSASYHPPAFRGGRPTGGAS